MFKDALCPLRWAAPIRLCGMATPENEFPGQKELRHSDPARNFDFYLPPFLKLLLFIFFILKMSPNVVWNHLTFILLSEMFRKKVVDINLNRPFHLHFLRRNLFFSFWRLGTRIVKLRLTTMKIASFFLEETKSLFDIFKRIKFDRFSNSKRIFTFNFKIRVWAL
jgi:hypothetical protein